MNKKYIAFGVIFFFSFAIALDIVVTRDDRTTRLNDSVLDSFEEEGIFNWTYEDFEEGGEYWRCLISPNEFNLPCSPRFNITYTECVLPNSSITNPIACEEFGTFSLSSGDQKDNLEDWEDQRMIDISIVKDQRKVDSGANKTREGEVTQGR